MSREIGVIEKMCSSYGFIQCCERQARLFFHYSQYTGRVEHLKLGDPVEFEMTYDRKTGKPIASGVVKISSGAMFDEQLSQDRVSGFITLEVTPDREGRVVYENRGECFFLPFSECDVENNAKLEAKDEVTFHISTDKSGNLRAKCLKLGMPTPAPSFKGVVCTLKDRFGFIKRADCDKEIFFHSSGCNNKIFNELNPNDCVEFDIQTRNGKEVAVNVTKLPFGSVQVEDSSSSVLNDYLTRSTLDKQATCNNSGSISNNSLSNFSNNNLASNINSNLTNIFDSIGTNSLLSSYQQHQNQLQQSQQNNISTSILSSIINSTLLAPSSPPQSQQHQQISWLSKPFEASKTLQQLFNKAAEEVEDDYPLIDLNTDVNSEQQQASNTDSMRYNFMSPSIMNGNGQRSGIKSDSWSEILTHLPLDLNLQINNDQHEDMNCAMPYRPEKALTKQFNEESRGPKVVLLRQPRVSMRWEKKFDLIFDINCVPVQARID